MNKAKLEKKIVTSQKALSAIEKGTLNVTCEAALFVWKLKLEATIEKSVTALNGLIANEAVNKACLIRS